MNENRTIADLILERYLLGELPEDEMKRIQGRLESDETLRLRIDALRESNGMIREEYPTDWMLQQIASKQEASEAEAHANPKVPGLRLPRLSLTTALPAALILALLIMMPGIIGPDRELPFGGDLVPTERLKGDGPRMQLFRKTDAGSERLADGAFVDEGDLILVGYQAAGHGYGLLLSIDGRGAVTRHLPESGRQAAALMQGETVPLPFAYELDDAPRIERFYFIASREPFTTEAAMNAARRLGAAIASGADPAPEPLDLPVHHKQAIMTLNKAARAADPNQGNER